jgi:hypothetical protein
MLSRGNDCVERGYLLVPQALQLLIEGNTAAAQTAAVIDSRVRLGYSMSAPSAVGRENAIA